MFRLILVLICASALAACSGAATPQLIGAYPPGDYTPPIAGYSPQLTLTYNARLEIEVRDTGFALYDLERIAIRRGGYLLSSHSWNQSGDWYGEAQIAVPADQLKYALGEVRSLGTVLSEELIGELEYATPSWGGSFSNITVQLRPESANWGLKVWGAAVWAFRGALWIIPPILTLIGFITVVRTVFRWIRRGRAPQ